jgi:hypothetical protein
LPVVLLSQMISKPTLVVSMKIRPVIRTSSTISQSSDMVLRMESSTGPSETHGEPTSVKMVSLESSEVLITSQLSPTALGPPLRITGLLQLSISPLMRRRTIQETFLIISLLVLPQILLLILRLTRQEQDAESKRCPLPTERSHSKLTLGI